MVTVVWARAFSFWRDSPVGSWYGYATKVRSAVEVLGTASTGPLFSASCKTKGIVGSSFVRANPKMGGERLETGKAGEERIAARLQIEGKLTFLVGFHFRCRIGSRNDSNLQTLSGWIRHGECDGRRRGLLS